MLLLLRKIIFFLLLPLYFAVTSYAVFYALGYIFNPIERELFKAGLISAVTAPRGAAVSIGGKKFWKRTPTTVGDLLPGSYRVRISRKGYEPWEKEIQVEPEKATRLEPVLLLPRRPDLEILSARPYRNFIPEILDFKIFAWEGERFDGLRKVDLLFKRDTSIDLKIPGAENAELLDFISKKGSELVLFKVKHEGKTKIWAGNLNRQRKWLDLGSRFLPSLQSVDWDPKNPDYLYFLENGVLSGVDLRRAKGLPIEIARSVKGFGVKHNRLYILREDFSLIQTDRAGKNPEPLFEDTAVSQEIFGRRSAAFYRIELLKRDFFQKDIMLFLSDRGALLSNRLPYLIAEDSVRGFEYAVRSEEEKVLFWTARKIAAIDFTREAAEEVFERGPRESTFYNEGRDIRQAFWAYEDSHVLFVDEDKVFLLETKNPPYLAREVARIAPGSGAIYTDRNHTIYYLDGTSGNLIRQKLSEI